MATPLSKCPISSPFRNGRRMKKGPRIWPGHPSGYDWSMDPAEAPTPKPTDPLPIYYSQIPKKSILPSIIYNRWSFWGLVRWTDWGRWGIAYVTRHTLRWFPFCPDKIVRESHDCWDPDRKVKKSFLTQVCPTPLPSRYALSTQTQIHFDAFWRPVGHTWQLGFTHSPSITA